MVQDLAREHARNQMDYVLRVAKKKALQGSSAHAAIVVKRGTPGEVLELADSAAKAGETAAAASILQSAANLHLKSGGKVGVANAQQIVDKLRSDELKGHGHAAAAIVIFYTIKKAFSNITC